MPCGAEPLRALIVAASPSAHLSGINTVPAINFTDSNKYRSPIRTTISNHHCCQQNLANSILAIPSCETAIPSTSTYVLSGHSTSTTYFPRHNHTPTCRCCPWPAHTRRGVRTLELPSTVAYTLRCIKKTANASAGVC